MPASALASRAITALGPSPVRRPILRMSSSVVLFLMVIAIWPNLHSAWKHILLCSYPQADGILDDQPLRLAAAPATRAHRARRPLRAAGAAQRRTAWRRALRSLDS